MQNIHAVPLLPQRTADANKGDCGKVLIVGGSRGMSGAPALAAKAAYRCGAGLVRVAVPECLWDVIAMKLDEAMSNGLPQTKAGTFSIKALKALQELSEWADVVVLGPGMSTAPETVELIQRFAGSCPQSLVLDADALNAFSAQPQKIKSKAPRVLTPHPGEMARLLKRKIPEIQADRAGAVGECARRTGAVTVLKGAGTLVCDGSGLYENTTGNPGMATGGTGDVLSGAVGALLGQGMSGFEAAVLGVYLHGLAGDLAARRKGVWSLIAGDLIDELPHAFLEHRKVR